MELEAREAGHVPAVEWTLTKSWRASLPGNDSAVSQAAWLDC